MFEQYVHTLIPTDPHFAPASRQVVDWFSSLSSLGAGPSDCSLIVMKPSGRVRFFTDPLTGEKRSFPANDRITLNSLADLAPIIDRLARYSAELDGHGPPALPPFALYSSDRLFSETYDLSVRCCLRAEPVSMSDPRKDEATPPSRDAVFQHSLSGRVIEVADAGRARFWIEFEFGKWLLPKIEESLNLLDPAIPALAQKSLA